MWVKRTKNEFSLKHCDNKAQPFCKIVAQPQVLVFKLCQVLLTMTIQHVDVEDAGLSSPMDIFTFF